MVRETYPLPRMDEFIDSPGCTNLLESLFELRKLENTHCRRRQRQENHHLPHRNI